MAQEDGVASVNEGAGPGPRFWDDLHVRAGQVFQPATPIQRKELFAGRIHEIARVADAVGQTGLHVAIYGERGVGKTSLANILSEVPLREGIHARRVNCDTNETFTSVWHKVARRLRDELPEGSVAHKRAGEVLAWSEIGPDDVLRLLAALEVPVVCIFDEFDRMNRAEARVFSDLVKSLSDNAIESSVVLVGVAETVTDLVEDHASVERALVQVQMPRMRDTELREILKRAAEQLGMTFSANAQEAIVTLSQGLPHYTHLLGRESVRAAIDMEHLCVAMRDVHAGIEQAIQDAQETIREQYSKAVRSSHADALYKQVLLACALAEKGDRSSFRASDVSKSMSRIMRKSYDIPAISKHLKGFSEDESRDHILIRSGNPRNFVYRFRNPLMESYVLMRGIADTLLPADTILRSSAND